MDIVKFDKNIKNSYFFEKNFNGIWNVSTINENMIEVDYLKEFHYQVSLILHLYSSLYIKLKRKEVDFGYNVSRFSDLVNNLNIRISDDSSKGKILGEFVDERTFVFYYRTFERYQSNVKEMYEEGNKDNPIFGYFDNKQSQISRYINNMIPSSIINMNLSRVNINNLANFRNKFNEIIGNILKQTPENMMGYLLYQKLNLNIIIFNINIQNYVRYKYLNNKDNTYLILGDNSNEKLNKIVREIGKLIKDRANQIILLNSNHFGNNDYLLEKNRYKDKINALDDVKTNYVKINDRYNLTMKKLKNNVKTYDKLRIFSYIIVGFIIILMIIFSILIYTRQIRFLYFLIILVILIIIGYLYYLTFNYINEKFVSASPSSSTVTASLFINPNMIVINSNDVIGITNYRVGQFTFNDKIFFRYDSSSRINIVINDNIIRLNEVKAEIYGIYGKAFLGTNNQINQSITVDNIYTPEYDTSNLNYYYNTSNYTHFKKVELADNLKTGKFYHINPEYIESNNPTIDRSDFYTSIRNFKLHLEFSGGESINADIAVKPPIVMVIFENANLTNKNIYIAKEIIIYNGGSYYKNLPKSALLREINKDGKNFFTNIIPINFNDFIFNANFLNNVDVFNHIANIQYVNRGVYLNNQIRFGNILPSNPILSLTPESFLNNQFNISHLRNVIVEMKNLTSYVYNILSLDTTLINNVDSLSQNTNYQNRFYSQLELANNIYLSFISNSVDNYNQININNIYNYFIVIINNFITIISVRYKIKLKTDIKAILDELKIGLGSSDEAVIRINNEKTRINNYEIHEEPFYDCFDANGDYICNTNNLITIINLIRTKLGELEAIKTRLSQSISADLNNIYLRASSIKDELLDITKHSLTPNQKNDININFNNIELLKKYYRYNCYFNNSKCSSDIVDLKTNLRNLVKIYAEVFYDEITIINDAIKDHYNISQRVERLNNKITIILIKFGNGYQLSSLAITLNDNNDRAQDYLDDSLTIKNRLLGDDFMDSLGDDLNTLINNKSAINGIKLNTVKISLILDKVDNSLDLYMTSIDRFEKIKDLGINNEIELEINKIKLNIYGGNNGNTNENINCGLGTSTITNNMKALLTTIITNTQRYLNSYDLDAITTNNRDVVCYNREVGNKTIRILSLIDTIRVFNSNNDLRVFDGRSNVHLQIHSKFYNDLNKDISEYITQTNNLLKNMSKNVYTIGSKTFMMEENNYLYDIYLKQKKEIENLKVKFNKNLINDDDIDKNKVFLYNLVFSLVVFCIIILIAINVHLYIYKSVLLNAMLVIFLMIFLIITNVLKVVQPTRMDNDKFYWFKFKKIQS